MAQAVLYFTTPPRSPTAALALTQGLELVRADVVARSHRARGKSVRLVAASLDMGRDVARAAYERGGTPQALAGEWAERIQTALKALRVGPDDFVRTCEARHQRVVKALFLKLFDQGDIEKTTREVATCPRCEERRMPEGGGQPRCPVCQEPLERRSEEAYILRAGEHAKAVKEHLASQDDFIRPPALRDSVLEALAEHGVADPSISGPQHPWAIPVPIDPQHSVEGWFDTLVSYLTATGYLADPQLFERCWPPAIQVVAAEQLMTHAVVWPALLAALGLPPPQRLVVSDAPPPAPAAEPTAAGDLAGLAERLGADALRYALLRARGAGVSEPQALQLRRSDLEGRLAWLVERTIEAIDQRRDGVVPRPGSLRAAEQALAKHATELGERMATGVDDFDFVAPLDALWDVVDRARDYMRETSIDPRGAQSPGTRQESRALYVLAEVCRLVAHHAAPFFPDMAAAIHRRLGFDPEGLPVTHRAQWGLLQPETHIRRGDPLLGRLAVPTDEGH
ncbi:MAG: class I tRNA ligase family protein [Candidatus Brocadiia bacterium]